jgi:hypothetical protein
MQASVMVAGCPAYTGNSGSVRCGLPAEAEGRHTMRSADRPLQSARIRCPRGHWFNGPGGFTPTGAMLATGAEPRTAASGRTVMQDRTLGRSGIKVSACPWAR